jgi:triphosphatase
LREGGSAIRLETDRGRDHKDDRIRISWRNYLLISVWQGGPDTYHDVSPPCLQWQRSVKKPSASPSLPSSHPRPTVSAEVELKLLASPAAIERIRAATVIRQHARNRGVVRRLEAVYYDTPDRALSRLRSSLRVRRNGRRYVQTLKIDCAEQSPFARRQWETPVDTQVPDLRHVPAKIDALLSNLDKDSLTPVFATKIRRHAQRLTFNGAEIEIAFDEGMVEVGERQEPLVEIELELKAGETCALYDVGMQLLDVAPFRISTLSKADQGYALAFDVVPQAMKAEDSNISAKLCVDDAIAMLMSAAQKHLLANQAIVEDGRDPEGVHQTRVALRRLRTVCSLLRKEVPSPAFHAFGCEAKWLMQVLGPARDWDVFVTTTLARLEKACAPDVDFAGLRRAAEPHRVASYAALREALIEPRYTRFQLSLRRWIERRNWRTEVPSYVLETLAEPVSALAGRVLTRLHCKALREGAHFERLQIQERHDLRITLKKLRYAAEFFRPIFAQHPSAKRYVAQLSKLQDALGYANDSAATRSLLVSVTEQAEATPDIHQAVGALIGWSARDRLAVPKILRRRWRKFKTATEFWRD